MAKSKAKPAKKKVQNNGKCSICGKKTKETDKICLKCKAEKDIKGSKDSVIAASVLSFFIPGLGQVYNHEYLKAIIIFIFFIIGLILFIIPGIIVWLYGIYDAYKIANDKLK